MIGFDENAEIRGSIRGRVLDALKWIERKRKGADKQPVHPAGWAEEVFARFEDVQSLTELTSRGAEFQVVLECIYEDLKLKQELLSVLAADLSADHIFWTNTSSLDVLEMGRPAGITNRLVCTHGMNPVYIMAAVETVKTYDVDEGVFALTTEILKAMNKVTFIAANVNGFWVNGLLVPFALDAMRALERGEITVADGDTGLFASLGHPQGIFKLSDLIGTATMYRVAMEMYRRSHGDPRLYPPAILARMFREGHMGQATGQGFWRWDGMKPTDPVDFTTYQITASDTILFAAP